MEKHRLYAICSTFLFFCYLHLPPLTSSHDLMSAAAAGNEGDVPKQSPLQTYIVHLMEPDHMVISSQADRKDWHKSFLPSPALDSGVPRMVYSYEHAISGFAARLTPEEVEAMRGMEGFLQAQLDEPMPLDTTHTPAFLGLKRAGGLWDHANMGEGMIVGVIDSGIKPDHPSFNDDRMPPVPARWRGGCNFGPGVCNKKLIGARVFNESAVIPLPPTDDTAHGTHVASIAAGNFVNNAEIRGGACGIAAGAAPRAHLAVYKVVTEADTLRGIDQAISDGVDVINLSMGRPRGSIYEDNIAIGALSAVKKGIFVAVSAGNSGPAQGNVHNDAPWALTVGASTTDRVMKASLRLGDGQAIHAESKVEYYKFKPTPLPLVYPGDGRSVDIQRCNDPGFGGLDVDGKIVMCMASVGRDDDDFSKGCNVIDSGGKAMVLMNDQLNGSTILYDQILCLPTVQVRYRDAQTIKAYVRSTANSTMAIRLIGTRYRSHPYPVVASFSSRGPSRVNNGVLKPDILGPGVSIVGANAIPGLGPFVFNSGTSMSSPHLAGIAALLKKSHPDWSPAAIKSAIMTTSDVFDSTGNSITDETGDRANLFATGAGHVNATRANNPGLVYDMDYIDYTPYLCGLGYTKDQVNAIARGVLDCSAVDSITGEHLNYPSFFVNLGRPSKTIWRYATNVGPVDSSYTLSVDEPDDVHVDVFPRRLDFSNKNQKRSIMVIFTATKHNRRGESVQGQLRWTSGHHVVRSPISVTFT